MADAVDVGRVGVVHEHVDRHAERGGSRGDVGRRRSLVGLLEERQLHVGGLRGGVGELLDRAHDDGAVLAEVDAGVVELLVGRQAAEVAIGDEVAQRVGEVVARQLPRLVGRLEAVGLRVFLRDVLARDVHRRPFELGDLVAHLVHRLRVGGLGGLLAGAAELDAVALEVNLVRGALLLEPDELLDDALVVLLAQPDLPVLAVLVPRAVDLSVLVRRGGLLPAALEELGVRAVFFALVVGAVFELRLAGGVLFPDEIVLGKQQGQQGQQGRDSHHQQ